MTRFILCIGIAIFNLAIFIAAGALHDNRIMREEIEAMKRQQLEQAQQIRQIQTDTDAALKIIISGDMEGRK